MVFLGEYVIVLDQYIASIYKGKEMKPRIFAFITDLSLKISVNVRNDKVGTKIGVKGRVGNTCNTAVCHTASRKRTKSKNSELERLALVLSNICQAFSDDLSNVLYHYAN